MKLNFTQYISNSISGLLILGAAVFLPKFILSMIFQAGTAIHDAFRSGHQQMAGKAGTMVAPTGEGKLARGGRWALGKAGIGGDAAAAVGGQPGGDSTIRSVNRENLQNDAMKRTNLDSGGSDSRSSTRPAGAGDSANGGADQSSVLTEENPIADQTVQRTSGDGVSLPGDGSGGGDGSPSPDDGETEEQQEDPKVKLNTKEWIGSHYKGTLKAIPEALSNRPSFSENPLQMGMEARTAWRAAKRKNIRQVRGDLRAVKAQEIASQPPGDKPPRRRPPPPPPPPDTKLSGDEYDAGGNRDQSQDEPERATPKPPGDGGS